MSARVTATFTSANIAVLDGQPVAFDAIEFDRVVASGDVLYDLAFLLMDLVERGLNGEANAILNGYFSATRRLEDSDALAALPFFMSIRAAIRAKAMTALITNTPEQRRAKISQSAIRYFKLALHLLESVPPTIICVGGLSGTGKSILAKSLAPLVMPLPGALIVRSDTERKAMFGVGETERLPPVAYQPGIRARIYAVLREKARRIAGAGYSVVVDAMFAEPSERTEIEVIARETRATFQGVFLVAVLIRACSGSAVAARIHRTRPPRSPVSKTNSTLAIWVGSLSMPVAPRSRPWIAYSQRWLAR